jgi:hypothetical protein
MGTVSSSKPKHLFSSLSENIFLPYENQLFNVNFLSIIWMLLGSGLLAHQNPSICFFLLSENTCLPYGNQLFNVNFHFLVCKLQESG